MCSATDASSAGFFVRHRAGFTLIETICTLVLLGVLGSLSLSALFTGMRAYTETRHWSRDTTQATLAFSRLHKELYALDSVESVSEQTCVFLTSAPVVHPDGTRTDGVSRTTIEYRPTERTVFLQGSPLLDGVRFFAVHLRSGNTTWTPDMLASQLSFVEIVITRSSTGPKSEDYGTFKIGVCPRNNGNSAGSPFMNSGETP